MSAPLQPTLETSNSKRINSTKICQKLLWICYFYCCCLGMVAFRLRKYKDNNYKNGITIVNKNLKIIKPDVTTTNVQIVLSTKCPLYEVYTPRYLLVLHIVLCIFFVVSFTCGILKLWLRDDFMFAILIYSHVASIGVCPLVMISVEVFDGEKIRRSLNSLFRLFRDIQHLNKKYDIFQWTHVGFVALKILVFIIEIFYFLYSMISMNIWYKCLLLMVQCILTAKIWMNYHVVTLLYVVMEAIYGSLNHYMCYDLVSRLQAFQIDGENSRASMQSKQLRQDMEKFMELYRRAHRLGLELHSLWQLPLICTLLSIYIGLLTIIYFLIWKYIQFNVIYLRSILFITKLAIDFCTISIAAHRVIQSSKLIGCMGLERAHLNQDVWWHKQMEQFLYYLRLNEFKLNLMGLFDISNAVTLTFVSGLLSAISIFIPFALKTYRLKMFMAQQN